MGVTLPFTRLEPFGVEIHRDLADAFAPSEAYHFRELFNAHGLLLARGQDLTMARQRELCALLGPILLREGEDGYMSNAGGGPAASALTWHSDAAYTDAPFDALSLHAVDVVDGASSTRFCSAERACAELPADLRGELESREQEMIAVHYSKLAERTCDQRDPEAQKRGIQPAIFVNPHNSRPCIWTSELQTVALRGMEWEASRDLLHRVYDRLYDDANVHEHAWRKGDLIVWDNIALQHARGNIEQVGTRVLQRVIVGTAGVAPHIST